MRAWIEEFNMLKVCELLLPDMTSIIYPLVDAWQFICTSPLCAESEAWASHRINSIVRLGFQLDDLTDDLLSSAKITVSSLIR
jgi:hypothetical protein